MLSLEVNVTDTVNSTAATEYTNNILVLFISLSLGLVGFNAHALVVAFTLKSKQLVSRIISSISVAQLILCVMDGLWASLSYALQQPLGTTEGAFTTYIFFGASANLDILLALNRFIATHKPQHYKAMFTSQRIWIYLGCIWTLGMVMCIPYGIPGCRFLVDYKMFRLTYENTPCGKTLDLCSQAFGVVSLVSMVLNILTFSKLKKTRNARMGALRDEEAQRRAQREQAFFIQSCVTSSTTVLIIVCINYLSFALLSRWGFYVITNLMPLLLITTEGIIMLVLNTDAQKALRSILHRLPKQKRMEVLIDEEAQNVYNDKETGHRNSLKSKSTALSRATIGNCAANVAQIPGTADDETE